MPWAFQPIYSISFNLTEGSTQRGQTTKPLAALDLEGKPLGLAIVWYNEALQYCELEPLGVVWWCRRQGIGRALIYELANRVIKKYSSCKGMIGGDQQFYWDLGFETKAWNEIWQWERRF